MTRESQINLLTKPTCFKVSREVMKTTLELLREFGEEWLVFDGKRPCVTEAAAHEECCLYGLSEDEERHVLTLFEEISGQSLTRVSSLNELSGGQKVIFSALLALSSRAKNLLFINFFLALHESKKRRIEELIRQSPKTIRVIEDV
ncbi:hypothetical protein U14_02420 [Candidatus Moduliflexus flocculans]|uniref:Uncharacterized protein n=1 Tax=Candidatus Moduliflexus flocculans TaxID=1499966 RepID=A0A081BLB2_9BACT|nr:hypothetical protein U14_02420 [Candidatus Moduliflexus flocculans]